MRKPKIRHSPNWWGGPYTRGSHCLPPGLLGQPPNCFPASQLLLQPLLHIVRRELSLPTSSHSPAQNPLKVPSHLQTPHRGTQDPPWPGCCPRPWSPTFRHAHHPAGPQDAPLYRHTLCLKDGGTLKGQLQGHLPSSDGLWALESKPPPPLGSPWSDQQSDWLLASFLSPTKKAGLCLIHLWIPIEPSTGSAT